MTVEQVADYLQLNKLTVYKYIRNGRLPAFKLGKSYRVRRSDIEWFLDNARVGARRAAVASAAAPAARRPTPVIRVAARKPAEDVYVGPQRRAESEAPQAPRINPMDWVIRGLH
jgi:excisionase family DNA binding protein